MALTPSTMLELGTPAPAFSLSNTEGDTVSLANFADAKALLVIFMCNHCPFVLHVADELAKLGKQYQAQGVAVAAINSNDVANHPEDAPDKMKQGKAQHGYTFDYLYDETQQTARAFRAACTPDFYLFDGARKLVYRGQMDDSRPDNGIPVSGLDLRAAMDAVLAGQSVPADQKPSMGCNIKWATGREPAYVTA